MADTNDKRNPEVIRLLLASRSPKQNFSSNDLSSHIGLLTVPDVEALDLTTHSPPGVACLQVIGSTSRLELHQETSVCY